MATDLRVHPILLGRAVKRFCRTNASFDILWSGPEETKGCGWTDGGCWILAAAIQQRWGGELYCLTRTGFDAQHVVVRFGNVFIDQDGPASAMALIRRFERWECVGAKSLWLVPFSTNVSGSTPRPRFRREIVAGISIHLSQIHQTLIAQYAKERKHNLIPVVIAPGKTIALSPGEHSELIRAIIEDFAPRFAPGSVLVYAGDTGDKWGYFDKSLLADLGVEVDAHGKMPDVVLHYTDKNWLLLIESVTSHGPVDGKRHAELSELFAGSRSGLVYVTAFPNRAIMGRYLGEIAWETEVWVADAPSHLIHFNGERFLGPYSAA